MLLQPGLDEKWWADSMECYYYLRNVQDLGADVKTPHERRFETGQGSTNLARKFLPGIFLGCAFSLRNLGMRRSGCRHWGIGKDGINAKEVLTPPRENI